MFCRTSRHCAHIIIVNLPRSTFVHPRQRFCWCWLALTQSPELSVAELCKSCTSIEILSDLKGRNNTAIAIVVNFNWWSQSLSLPLPTYENIFFCNPINTHSVCSCPCGLRLVHFEQLGFCIGALQCLFELPLLSVYECKSSALHIERTCSSMKGVNWFGDIQCAEYKLTGVKFMSALHSLKVILTE